MKTIVAVVLLLAGCLHLAAQTDPAAAGENPVRAQHIKATRLELRAAFLREDPVAVGLWLDSLSRLSNEMYAAVSWDERWLLYFWQENYGALFSEVRSFGQEERDRESYKIAPPDDSLFESIDNFMYAQRFDYFRKIGQALLNEEERTFSVMLLEYLLRTNGSDEEWAAKIEAFEKRYPQSGFLKFLQTTKPRMLKPANKGIGGAMSFLAGNWSDAIDRSFKPLYAFDMDLYYWVERWSVNLNFSIGGPAAARDIPGDYEVWTKGDPSEIPMLGLSLGYDVLNTGKLRITPAVVGAMAFLHPPLPDTDSGEEPPPYYDEFQLFEAHAGLCLTTDLKLFRKNYRDWDLPKGSYHGIRVKVGYNWLNFGKQNDYLKGNLFYFTVGYNLFAYLVKK